MDLLARIDPRLAARAKQGAAWVHEQKAAGRTVTVVHHIDADGVTSGAIAIEALDRAGCSHRSVPAKSLDDVHIAALQDGDHDALWFCDFGSTAYMHFDVPRLVCDHHQLVRDGTEEDFPHVNPLMDGLEGDEISGAGCAYLVAHALSADNQDLLPIALVGATADLQNRHGGFHGTNQHILAVGTEAGLLTAQDDLAFFGPETRDLRTFLAYADISVPGATGSRKTAEQFLAQLDVDCRTSWSALDEGHRRRIRSALVNRLLDCGLPLEGLFRQVVTLAQETPGTPVHEMQEFGTLLNSTARYDEPDIGLAVARGDRDKAFQEALSLRNDHKKHLVKSLDALAKQGIQETDALQWVHLEDHVRDTVVGIVCGMALDGLGLRRDRPLIGFAHTPDGRTKVSSRAPHELKGRIDLATAMREGSAIVGGQGGGHEGAAGATIPRGSEPAFLEAVEGVVGAQLGLGSSTQVQPTGQMRLF
ncbi:MAG: DHHA1 domain-containing protein [Thermoplasmatota archaeon]